MLFTVLIYLLISVPILFYLIGWRLTGDAKVIWRAPTELRTPLFWNIVGFALGIPLLLAGVGCSLFNAGGYIYNFVQRTTGQMRGDITIFCCSSRSSSRCRWGWAGILWCAFLGKS